MEYLHRSDLKSHGYLRSKNCLVDGRWVLQITDWGCTAFREYSYDTDDEKYLGTQHSTASKHSVNSLIAIFNLFGVLSH